LGFILIGYIIVLLIVVGVSGLMIGCLWLVSPWAGVLVDFLESLDDATD